MKKFLTCVSAVAFAATAFASEGTDNIYIRGDVGVSKVIVSHEGGKGNLAVRPVYNLGVGYKLNDNFRSDLNIQYRNAPFSKNNVVKVINKTIFLNGYYDFKNESIFTPYLTAGVGIARNNLSAKLGDVSESSSRSTAFAWNAGLGSKINVTKNIDVDFAYRYSGLGEVLKGSKVKLSTHEVTTGVIYNF